MDHKLKNIPLACLNQGKNRAGGMGVGGGKSANRRGWFAGAISIIHSAKDPLNGDRGARGGKF